MNLLAKESKKQNAIVVFPSDNELAIFQERLKSYSGLKENSPKYGYLDAIEELVPLEREDRIGRLLELEPLESQELAALDLELWHTGNEDELRSEINNLDEFLKSFQEYPDMRVLDRYIGEYLCLVRIKVRKEIVEILLEYDPVKEIDRRPKPTFESPREISIPISEFPEIESPPDNNCGVLVIDSGVQTITVDLFPGTNLRKKGTLQKGEIKISSKTWTYDGKSMYVVVACNRKWAREYDVESQRYALVVSISHSDAKVNLYNSLQAEIQNRVRSRTRIRQ